MTPESAKTVLLARRAELVSDMTDIEQSLETPLSPSWEDRASERQGDEVLESLGQADLAELRRIDAALQRIEAGEYGLCRHCGEAISDGRLALLPETPLCAACAAKEV